MSEHINSLSAKGELRPVSEIRVGSCDWGNCDDPTYAERWSSELGEWLEVCRRHAGKKGLVGVPEKWGGE